ncbi:hypothetical protein ES702_05227 [subsurface metagenome]
MDYLYLRISSQNQSTDPQQHALQGKYPNAQVVSEVASGAKSRPILKALVKELKPGDRLITYALDRLGRKTSEILLLIEDLQERGIDLISEREGVNYSTAVGRLISQVLLSVAELERSLISERTKAGLDAARAKGRVGGRPKKYTDSMIADWIQEIDSGHSIRSTAKKRNISYGHMAKLVREYRDNV